MTTIDDGGPAHPVPDTIHGNGQIQYGSNGMSLRDYFAAKAMLGWRDTSRTFDEDARDAYKMADAMLKARGVV